MPGCSAIVCMVLVCQGKGPVPINPSLQRFRTTRNTDTITFSLSPEMAQELRQVVKEEERTVSELLREAIRLNMDEREWRTRERLERLRSRRTGQDETQGGETDE